RARIAGGVGGIALGGVNAVRFDADGSRCDRRSDCVADGGRTDHSLLASAPGVAHRSADGSAARMSDVAPSRANHQWPHPFLPVPPDLEETPSLTTSKI